MAHLDRRQAARARHGPAAARGDRLKLSAAPQSRGTATGSLIPIAATRTGLGYSAAAALDRVTVPTLLISGFHDFFVEQTMRQYQALRRPRRHRGPDDRPVEPHDARHGHDDPRNAGVAGRLCGRERGCFSPPAAARAGVDVWPGPWRELAQWPPAADHCPGVLSRDRRHAGRPAAGHGHPARSATAAAGGGAAAIFRYDPADPTPSVGGRTMSHARGGSQDNTALEARADVLTFTTGAAETAVEVAGVPVVRLHVCSDNPCSRPVRPAVRSRSGRPVTEPDRPDRPVRPGRVTAGRTRSRRPAYRCLARIPGRSPDPASGLRRRAPAVRPQSRHRRGPDQRHQTAP